MRALKSVLAAGLLILPAAWGSAQAADLIILGGQGNVPGLNELAAAFARTSGHKVTVLQEVGQALERRLDAGPADLIAVNPPGMEDLVKKNKVVAATVA